MDRQYRTKINLEGEYAYEDVSLFLEKISLECDKYKHGGVYFLDKDRYQRTRVDSKNKTVELTDKVEEWIFNSINELSIKKWYDK